MSDIRKVGPHLGLQAVDESMSAEQQCSVMEENIELLLDLEWRSNLLLGAELSKLKYSGKYTSSSVWKADDRARGWKEYISRRDFQSKKEGKSLSRQTANDLIMWSSLYACFADENQRRADRGQLPLPQPTSISQLRPYHAARR